MDAQVKRAEVEDFKAAFGQAVEAEIAEAAELLAGCQGQAMFGAPEFALRGMALRMAAKILARALEERKKAPTPAPKSPAPTAARWKRPATPPSRSTAPSGS